MVFRAGLLGDWDRLSCVCLFFLVRGTLFYSILSERGFKAVGFLLVSVHSDPGENGKKGGGVLSCWDLDELEITL